MTLAARQQLLARFIDDRGVEAAVRRDPMAAARAHGVEESYARWLASLSGARVASFRKSRAHKDAVRGGRQPTRVE